MNKSLEKLIFQSMHPNITIYGGDHLMVVGLRVDFDIGNLALLVEALFGIHADALSFSMS